MNLFRFLASSSPDYPQNLFVVLIRLLRVGSHDHSGRILFCKRETGPGLTGKIRFPPLPARCNDLVPVQIVIDYLLGRVEFQVKFDGHYFAFGQHSK